MSELSFSHYSTFHHDLNLSSSCHQEIHTPSPLDLFFYPILISLWLLVLKYFVLIPYFYSSIAVWCGISANNRQPPPFNKALEVIFKKHGAMPKISMDAYAQTLGMTSKEILRWLRVRYTSVINTRFNKFIDCSWQLSYYVLSCSIGIYCIHDKPWLFDFSYCWTNFPCQEVPEAVWVYYMFAQGFYWQEIFTHSIHPKKKDSLQNLAHHFCAIFLLSATWFTNIVRLGTICTLMLECNDIPLLIAKLLIYTKKRKYVDALFIVFICVWVVFRLIIYPFGVMKQGFFIASVRNSVITNMLIVVMCVLMVMNLVWTYSIAMVVVKKLRSGETQDCRSSDESEDEKED